MKTFMQKYWPLAIVGAIVLAVAIWFTFSSNRNGTVQESESKSVLPETNPPASSTPTATGQQAWIGTLQLSKAPAKGNYIIVTKDHSIYLKTSRDFSGLVGKEVTVTYQGTLESFMLGDIFEHQPE